MELVLCKEKTPPEDFSSFRFVTRAEVLILQSALFESGEFLNITKCLGL